MDGRRGRGALHDAVVVDMMSSPSDDVAAETDAGRYLLLLRSPMDIF